MRRAAAAVALSLCGLLAATPQGSAGTAARRALLERGADPIKGLPFFSPNAIAALSGAYDLGASAAAKAAVSPIAASRPAPNAPMVGVWYTREDLVIGSAWKRAAVGGASGYALSRSQGIVLALRGQGYSLFFELPSGEAADDPAALAFIKAFDRKFLAFFENAATDAELSFPAYVDY